MHRCIDQLLCFFVAQPIAGPYPFLLYPFNPLHTIGQGGGNQAFYYVDPDTTYENQGSASTDLFWFGCDVTNPQVTGTFNTTLTMEDVTVYEQGAIERIDL